MRRCAFLDVGLGVAHIALCTPAFAQGDDPANARALFDAATTALDHGDWDGACPKFDASFALKQTISALLNIAKCHTHSGKLTLAAEDYHRALTLNEETANPQRKKELGEFANDGLHALEARIPKVHITLKDPPADVQVTLDDHALPAASLNLDLLIDPGDHVVVASASGRKTDTQRVTIAEGKSVEIALNLVPEIAAPSPPPLALTPVPAPAPASELPPTPPSRGGVPTWALVGGIAGVAFGAAAVVFAINGSGANCGGVCGDNKYTQADVDSLNARRHRDLGLGLAFGGLGAIGLAIGGVGIATAPRSQSTTGLVVHIWTGSGIAGVGFRGGF